MKFRIKLEKIGDFVVKLFHFLGGKILAFFCKQRYNIYKVERSGEKYGAAVIDSEKNLLPFFFPIKKEIAFGVVKRC